MSAPPPGRSLRRILCLDDFEPHAQRRLPRPIHAYIAGGVEDDQSKRANRDSFLDYGFKPRVLRDVSQRSTGITLFGRRYAAPFGVAPMGLCALTAYRGDIALAQAARDAGIPCVLSGSSLIRLEEVIDAAPGTWFQAYLPGDATQIAQLIDRVEQAGVHTLVVTVDTPVSANRENNLRAGFSAPLRPSLSLAWQGITHPRWLLGTFARTLARHGMPHFENNFATRGAPIVSSNVLRDFAERGHLTWEHLRVIRRRWRGPMIIKGILNAEDAATAVDAGMDGLIVSNHGGRQLDGSVAPLRVLPEIVEAARDRVVMLDSGVRRGTDVLKAIALGARCVFVGRPFAFALAVAQRAGAAHAMTLLQQEIARDMGMLGLRELDELTPAWLAETRRIR